MKAPVSKVSNYHADDHRNGPSTVSLGIAIVAALGAAGALAVHHFRPYLSVLRDADVTPTLVVCGGAIAYILWWLAAAEQEKPITKGHKHK